MEKRGSIADCACSARGSGAPGGHGSRCTNPRPALNWRKTGYRPVPQRATLLDGADRRLPQCQRRVPKTPSHTTAQEAGYGAGRRESGRGVARDAFSYPTTDAGARDDGRDAREDGPRGRLRRRRARRALRLLLVVLWLLLTVIAALLLVLLWRWLLLRRRRRRRRRRAPLAPLAARCCCRCEQRCNGDGSSSFHAAGGRWRAASNRNELAAATGGAALVWRRRRLVLALRRGSKLVLR